jgi:nucleoside-diphosphate-sugar epimerase
MKRILITGITGLIGKSVLSKLIQFNDTYDITAIIRPDTNPKRFLGYKDKIKIEYIDLTNIEALKVYLSRESFHIILHIGAIRGGRRFSKQLYYDANVRATEQLVDNSLKNKSRFIFCSSVGVFGAIPDEIPANNESPYKEDNYYHYTKIVAEKIINRAILKGLDAVILRPSITYGTGDKGFPYQLVKMVNNNIFPICNKNIWIHMCNIDTIASAFIKLINEKSSITGVSFNIADVEPVQLKDLVNFIKRQLSGRNYSKLLVFDSSLFTIGYFLSNLIHSDLWKSRFELISKSWFYSVRESYLQLDLPSHFTIPDFNIVIKDFTQNK